jgi:pimeloyl-ACP methyl ester carboxylesterase
VPDILIYGIDTLLGSHCAARWLQVPEGKVLYAAESVPAIEAIEWVANAAGQIDGRRAAVCTAQEISARLQPALHDVNASGTRADASISEVWCFADGRANRGRVETLTRLVSCWADTHAAELNYVAAYRPSANDSGEQRRNARRSTARQAGVTPELYQLCGQRGIALRTFETSLIVGNVASRLQARDPVSQFLSLLYAFKLEIEERSPQYFDFHALRCVAAGHAALDLLTADTASELLTRIGRETPQGRVFRIGSRQNVPFAALCDCISVAFNMSLLPVDDPGVLNAIDRAFCERLECIQDYWAPGAAERPGMKTGQEVCIQPQDGELSEEAQVRYFESVRKALDQAAAVRSQRIADLPNRLTRKTIARNASELTYSVNGSTGPVVVLLNALGQGLEYWYRLMDELVDEYRLIIWESRGTNGPFRPFGLADQVDDLEAVLEHEGVAACHVVCWCTSPKVAIDFHLRHPSILRSMTFLNSTFKCDGSPEELDTPYEKNLYSLCRMLVRKPGMAASVMKTFQSRTEENEVEVLEGTDSEQMSVTVLSMMNAELKPYVLGPFQTEETTLNYAHQMMDFWANDSRQKAARVTIPVLLIGAEYDQIISPASSEMGAGLFPVAWHVHLTGATHYFLYDRAEMLSGLLKTFFENPGELPIAQHKLPAVAHAS